VVAVPSHVSYRQVQIDLGGHAHGNRLGHNGKHGPRVRGLARVGGNASYSPHRHSPAIRANSQIANCSARRRGSTPAARSSRSAAAAEPAHPARAARSVLRRWLNAASTSAKTCSLGTVDGAGRAVSATKPESTCGTGQNTARGTCPARRTSANQATLALGTP